MAELAWPNGAKVAVSFSIALEGWQPGKAPGIGPMGNPLPAGVLDTQAISWGEYGARAGIWRLLDILAYQGIRASVMASGVLAERTPEAVKAVVDGGHELVAHAYSQEILPAFQSEEDERADIRRCADLLERASGLRPAGWASPRGTPSLRSAALLAEAGYTWSGDYFDRDLPYVIEGLARPFVAVPFTMDVNDLPLYMRYGQDPQSFVDRLRAALTWMRERERGLCKLDVTVHAHVFGRPACAWAYDQAIALAKSQPDVWIATLGELADLALRAHSD